ncbi:MAG TPA: hypothetical protein VIM89_06115 [Mucilaginibacter sp.]
MYLAYSALRTPSDQSGNHPETNPELLLRYQAYLNACNRYSTHIAEIQKYFPGWLPKFR